MQLALEPINELIAEFKCGCISHRHGTKGAQAKGIYRGQGNMSLIGVVRSGLLVGHDPDYPHPMVSGVTRGVLTHSKTNYSAYGKSLLYEISGKGFEWKGISDTHADLLNRQPDSADRDQVGRAMEFLTEFLKEGSRPQKEVEEYARETENISKRTLVRAKEQRELPASQLDMPDVIR
jgi:hypothetical protein